MKWKSLVYMLITSTCIAFSQEETKNWIDSIVKRNIFGLQESSIGIIQPHKHRLSTQRNWEILGIILKRNQKLILIKVGGKLELRKEGDNFLNYTVKKINKDSIILEDSKGIQILIKLHKKVNPLKS